MQAILEDGIHTWYSNIEVLAHLRVFYDQQPKTEISGPSQLENTKTGASTRTTYNQVKAHATSHVIGQKHVVPVYLYQITW